MVPAVDPGPNDSTWRNLDLLYDWAVELPFAPVKDVGVKSHGFKPVRLGMCVLKAGR